MRFILLLAGMCLAAAGPASAEKWAVSAIKYKNKGAYYAYFDIFSMYNGAQIECQGRNTKGNGINTNQSITIQLDNSDDSLLASNDNDCLPAFGKEVWGMVYIDRGFGYSEGANKESCRKDGAKFHYHPDGGMMIVETKGTTENNNRCRITGKGGVRWEDVSETGS